MEVNNNLLYVIIVLIIIGFISSIFYIIHIHSIVAKREKDLLYQTQLLEKLNKLNKIKFDDYNNVLVKISRD